MPSRHSCMRVQVLLVAAAAACLAAAACGASPTTNPLASSTNPPAKSRPSAAGRPTPDASSPPSVGASRLWAQQEAERLLALARVPPGATQIASAPPSLPGPAMGTPVVDSVVDKARFWRVAMPSATTLAWIHAHGPRGLVTEGSMNGGGAGTQTGGYSYTEPGADPGTSPALEMGVASAGDHASVIRADGMVIWLDPRPVRDAASGRRMRVTVERGCPATDARAVGVTNVGRDLDRQLLPSADPVAGLICRYDGLNGHPALRLHDQQRLDAAAARRLARAMGQIRLSHPDGGATSCPADDESVTVLALSYTNRSDVDVWFARTGCPRIANGHISADARSFGQVLDHIDR